MYARNALSSRLIDVTNQTTLDGVLEQAGLNYEVGLQELHSDVLTPDGVTRVNYDHMGVVRTDTLTPLGVVGERYTPIQNADAFAPLQYLKDEGFIEAFEQAGVVENGQRAFIIARLSEGMNLGDKHTARLLFSTSHDGSGSYSVRAIAERLFCKNQIPRLRKLGRGIAAIKHTQSATQRVTQVRQAVMAEISWFDEYTDWYSRMLDTPADHMLVGKFARTVAPLPPRDKVTDRQWNMAVKRQDQLIQRIGSPANRNIDGTVAALFQGAVEYSDYGARGNNADRILLGRDIEFKVKAWESAIELIPAAF